MPQRRQVRPAFLFCRYIVTHDKRALSTSGVSVMSIFLLVIVRADARRVRRNYLHDTHIE